MHVRRTVVCRPLWNEPMGRDHTLALYRASAAVLFVVWLAVITGLGARYSDDPLQRAIAAELALRHPPEVNP
jgi:hypothetical protein